MTRLKRTACWISLSFLLSSCVSNSPGQRPGTIAVRLGSVVAATLERNPDGSAVASVGRNYAAGEQVVTFFFREGEQIRMLEVLNSTKYFLKMNAVVCINAGAQCAESSVVPLHPGQRSFESWADPIDLIYLDNFRLEEAS